jgi:hypothetical protein
MTLKEFSNHLRGLENMAFFQEDGLAIDPHYHLTEVGIVSKRSIDCGMQKHDESQILLQLHYGADVDHRLTPVKVNGILKKTSSELQLADLPVQIEMQGKTLEIYGLDSHPLGFQLKNLSTTCKAADACGIIPLASEKSEAACCSAESNCC